MTAYLHRVDGTFLPKDPRTVKATEVALRKLDDAGFKLIDVERELGLSAGYLSKVRKRVEPSFQLVALLSLVADEPLRATAKLHGLRRT